MSKNVQIGSKIYIIPEAGDNPGYGEDTTAFFEGIVDALADIQGPNDILITSANLANNQTTPASVPGLVFNTGQVQHIEASFLLIRVYDSGATTVTESGKLYGNYDGSQFYLQIESVGDAGVNFDITNSGQVTYTSDNKTNHVSTTIRFKASTIDQP
jgi:hypothetical protein